MSKLFFDAIPTTTLPESTRNARIAQLAQWYEFAETLEFTPFDYLEPFAPSPKPTEAPESPTMPVVGTYQPNPLDCLSDDTGFVHMADFVAMAINWAIR